MLCELLVFVILVLVFAFAFIKKRYSYWKDLGVAHEKPEFPWGTLKGAGTKYHQSEIHQKLYKKYKDKVPFIGMYLFITPCYFILDLEIVKHILVKDFNNFVNRGVYYNEVDDPLSGHLFAIEDDKWRSLRAKLTPTFTSGKMKVMFPTIVAVAEEFKKCIAKEVQMSSEIEMKDILARFTTDVIGTCAFGLECNSLVDPEAEFRVMGRKVFQQSPVRQIKVLLLTAFKNLGRKLRMKSVPADVSEFFLNAVRETIEFREKNNVKRNDFMDLLITLKTQGRIDNDSGNKVEITFNEIAAQAFVFFLAGFETSSTAMSYALYELSLNEKIQEKGRQEVKRVLEKYGGEITYEAISEMKYIDQIINESLRKYPPVTALIRQAGNDWKVPGTDHTMKKGSIVFIPNYCYQHDKEFFPDPETFNPDHFSEDSLKNRNPYAWLPFGEGPRVCIGLRFGMMQARIGLATLLMNYKFSRCSKSIIPLNFAKGSNILAPEGGLWLNVQKI